jgi:Cellulose binding domain
MMQDRRSRPALPDHRFWWLAATLGAASVSACATGVDVTDGELAEICSDPGTSCNGVSSPAGSAGSSASGGSGTASNLGNASGGTFPAGVGGSTSPVGSGGQAGSSGAASAGSGTGGTGTPAQLPDGDCLAQSDVVILYLDRSDAPTFNQMTMTLSVQNTGPEFDLTDLTIRYWFTAEASDAFSFSVDYATLDGQQDMRSSTQVTFGEESGSNYAEIGFSMSGPVDADGVREVQLRFFTDNYAQQDQTNDFSFLPGATAATPNPNITPYVSGEQVGGCVPAL